MRWVELERSIPYLMTGPVRTLPVYPNLGIAVSQPGKYADVTNGGDFRVTCRGIAPKHSDKFELAQRFVAVGGHDILPVGGQQTSPVVDTRSPR